MRELGIETVDVRDADDLIGLNGLIMPGGESTTLRKLLKNSDLWNAVRQTKIPVMGTCAGAILLGKCEDETFEKMEINIDRNYYGRQSDSFQADIKVRDGHRFSGIFIRAPAITDIGNNVEPIAWHGNNIVGCIDGGNMALTFHPELTSDVKFHKLWIEGLK